MKSRGVVRTRSLAIPHLASPPHSTASSLQSSQRRCSSLQQLPWPSMPSSGGYRRFRPISTGKSHGRGSNHTFPSTLCQRSLATVSNGTAKAREVVHRLMKQSIHTTAGQWTNTTAASRQARCATTTTREASGHTPRPNGTSKLTARHYPEPAASPRGTARLPPATSRAAGH